MQVKSEAQRDRVAPGKRFEFQAAFCRMCAAGSIVMHNLSPTPKRIRAADVARDKDFLRLCWNLVINGKDDSIVFMVRSDGLGTFRALKRLCDGKSVRNGKIPVVGKGRIDLSAFREAK